MYLSKMKLFFQFCLFGETSLDTSIITFLATFLLIVFASIIAHICDRLTYHYVRSNSYAGNSNQSLPNNQNIGNNQVIQELTEHQKELLKIPLNAVQVSLSHFVVFGFLIVFRLLGMGNLSLLFRVQVLVTLICVLQGSRVVIILTCLHKANVQNQAELTQSERRAQRQEWERAHSFRTERHQYQSQPSTSSGSGTSMISASKSIPTQNDVRVLMSLLGLVI